MYKENNWSFAKHFNLVCIFIDSSVEHSDFEKKSVQFAMKLCILLAFQNLQEVN